MEMAAGFAGAVNVAIEMAAISGAISCPNGVGAAAECGARPTKTDATEFVGISDNLEVDR